MKTAYGFGLLALTAALLLAGCTGSEPKGTGSAVHPIKGMVVAVDSAKAMVTLDHEEIPGVMKAMKMEYQVEDAKLLEGLKPGDPVQGQLKVESGKYVITKLEKR